jgi:hypothetical protein
MINHPAHRDRSQQSEMLGKSYFETSGTVLRDTRPTWKSGDSGPGSVKPTPAKDGRSMGVRRTSESGVESMDDVADSDALRRRVGVRGLSAKEDSDANCPNT